MKISDEKLWELCREYGRAALMWRRKFIGLLPEVNRRRLYEKKGLSSIFEFAAKLAGLSAEQVCLVLRIEKRLTDKPALREVLVSGSASISKIAKVISIVNDENEEDLAEKVKILPRKALETLVRDERIGFDKPLFECKNVPGNVVDLELSEAVLKELQLLKSQGHDINAIFMEFLKARRERIEREKQVLAATAKPTESRYISAPVRSVLKEEFGSKCAIPSCLKPSEAIHHTQRFSLAHTHDPRYLAPLCREHHQIAHSVDVKVRDHWR